MGLLFGNISNQVDEKKFNSNQPSKVLTPESIKALKLLGYNVKQTRRV